MNDVLATNIRQHREQRSWTQEQLAGAAELSVRTVQRAEEGRGMSSETLMSIAGALDVSLETLRQDPEGMLAELLGVRREQLTPELVAAKAAKTNQAYTTIPLTVVSNSAGLREVFDADALYFDCVPEADPIQDLAAELKQWLLDLINLKGELNPADERDCLKSSYACVEQLREIGCVVSLGTHRQTLRPKSGDKMDIRTLYVIVAAVDEPKTFAVLRKNAPVSFRF